MEELKEGLWIVEGPNTNVLLRLTGTSPMLSIMGAIDLNYFYKTGQTRELAKDSVEITGILQYPQNYIFSRPTVSNSTYDDTTISSYSFEKVTLDEDSKDNITKFYQDCLPSGKDAAYRKAIVYAMTTYKLRLGQANYIMNGIIRRLKSVI
jgi:hypothetical protein